MAAQTASISGTISAPAGTDLKGFFISAKIQDGNAERVYGTINPDGSYAITGLPAGTYEVLVYGSDEFLQNSKVAAVADGQALNGIDFLMVKGAFIKGKVAVPAGVNSTEVLVTAFDTKNGKTGPADKSFFVGSDGQYTLWGLPAGTYKVRFSHNAINNRTLATQWYTNKSSYEAATAVQLRAGQTADGIDATMVVGAKISGKITGPDASLLPHICVGAFPEDVPLPAINSVPEEPASVQPLAAVGWSCPNYWFANVVSWTYPAPDGTYTIPALPSGKYKVVALPTKTFEGATTTPVPFAAKWYANKLLRSSATLTSVTMPQNLTGVDFALAKFSSFKDVAVGAQFFDDITWLGTTGVSTGYANGDGTFNYSPLSSVNRDAMAAFMYRLAGSPSFTPPTVSPFIDLAPSSQFYKEITWLAAQNISTGWTEPGNTKSFRPLQAVNRDAMAAFLYRFAGSPAFTPPAVSPFADVATDNQFYKQITWLAGTGISTGWAQSDGTKLFQPVSPVARDAMAAFMHRYQYLDSPELRIP
ncbi:MULTISPECIES: carboxypeptidase-like regulatory domain-containing protein [unclassified Paenarthrobacter]|uniref:carboxypeptidase-like regulatory domain-containing protein n=1 Tax=unclassified Paenarthrobacter TaxID=2634190 RepID=UPI002148E212|nr:carboxypeptidase-like regulatory domain-containing protein [Paenarthrobacter sp. UW852]MCR1162852.1 carboxypeptidase-like regulatory domain-containing protein [Paenarthrobacter sp. UW852]